MKGAFSLSMQLNLAILAICALISGCFGVTIRPPATLKTSPNELAITGNLAPFKKQCTPYVIQRLVNGTADANSVSLTVALSADFGGVLFADPSCLTPTTTVTIPGGQSSTQFYFRRDVASFTSVAISANSYSTVSKSIVVTYQFTNYFDAPTLDPNLWNQWGTVPVVQNPPTMDFNPTGPVYAGINSTVSGLDLTDSEAVFEVELSPTFPSTAFAIMYVCNSDCYDIAVTSGRLFCKIESGASIADVAYNPITMRFWRISHRSAGNMVDFSYSADGLSWTVLGSTSATITVTNVDVEIGIGEGATYGKIHSVYLR